MLAEGGRRRRCVRLASAVEYLRCEHWWGYIAGLAPSLVSFVGRALEKKIVDLKCVNTILCLARFYRCSFLFRITARHELDLLFVYHRFPWHTLNSRTILTCEHMMSACRDEVLSSSI